MPRGRHLTVYSSTASCIHSAEHRAAQCDADSCAMVATAPARCVVWPKVALRACVERYVAQSAQRRLAARRGLSPQNRDSAAPSSAMRRRALAVGIRSSRSRASRMLDHERVLTNACASRRIAHKAKIIGGPHIPPRSAGGNAPSSQSRSCPPCKRDAAPQHLQTNECKPANGSQGGRCAFTIRC